VKQSLNNMTDLLNLKGRTYIITGAASGIGKALSQILSELEARLLLIDINEDGLHKLQESLPTESDILILDLTQTDSIKGLIKAKVDTFGKLNGFVHCAGIPYISPLKTVNTQKSEFLYKLNTYAAIELAKVCSNKQIYAGEHGAFVLISSVYGLVGSAANVVYAMSKGAIISITKALAIELAPKGIRINCVAPGFVKTSMMDTVSNSLNESYIKTLESLHPMGLGEARAVAEPIAFLLSDAARWITGTVLSVDGGFTAQ